MVSGDAGISIPGDIPLVFAILPNIACLPDIRGGGYSFPCAKKRSGGSIWGRGVTGGSLRGVGELYVYVYIKKILYISNIPYLRAYIKFTVGNCLNACQ